MIDNLPISLSVIIALDIGICIGLGIYLLSDILGSR